MIDYHIHAHWEHNPLEKIKGELASLDINEAFLIPWVREKELGEDFSSANDYVLECSKDKDFKFHPFCSISMNLKMPKNISEFEGIKWHCLRDSRMFYTSWTGKELDILVRQIQEARLPLLIEDELQFIPHLVKKIGKGNQIIIPHMGIYPHSKEYQNLQGLWRKMQPYENVIFDSALAEPMLIRNGIRIFGKERVRYGSDSPFGTMKFELEHWKYALESLEQIN